MASEKCGLRRRNSGHRVLAVNFLSVILVFAFLFLMKGQTACAADLRTVRVGYYPVTNFQEHDEAGGVYRGYSYDFLLAVAQYAGWQYEFVPVTYSQGIRMLEDGQLDLMNGVEKTAENGSRLGFSTLSSGSSWSCLVMKPADISVAYEDFDAIGKLTVGLAYLDTHNSAFVDYCKDHDCMPKLIYFHSDAEVRKALEKGKIDACVVSSMLDTGMREIAKFSNVDYYLAVTKGNTDLLDRLNAAMNEMKADDPYFEENIYALYHAKSGTGSLVLSEDEKQYIAKNPAVTVTYIPDRYPISYRDRNGNFAGAIADISRELEQKTGLSFRYVSAGTYGEAMNLFASGDAEVMAGFPYDFKWALMKHAEVTSPFVTLSLFGVSRAGKEQGNTAGTSAGSYQEYLLASILREPYAFSGYSGTADCLKAVLHGDVSYTFLDSYQIEYYNRRADYRALTYKAIPGAEYRLSFGVSDRADPRLRSILDKALVSTGTDEIGEAFRRSVQTSESRSFVDFVYSNPRAAGFVFTLAGFLIAFVLGGIFYTRGMNRKNLELSKAAGAKADFLSTISHDMRTPLNGIIGFTELAEKTDDVQKREEYLNKIRISGNLLRNLINDTLDFTKIENNKYVLNPEVVSRKELLTDIIVPIRSVAEEKGVHFIIDTEKTTDGYIRADRLNLQKIILNLLSNAVKFTPEGGTVTLRIADVIPPENGCNVRISVSDTGIGIGREFQKEIFEPFSQEHDPTAGNQTGTGLGLSIVKKITELMGGSISLQSEKGKGSCFTVLLPIEAAEQEKESSSPAKNTENQDGILAGKRILLCEDNEMNTEIARTLLETKQLRVTCTGNGKEGLDLYLSSPPGTFDLILMDLRMPVMNGYDAVLHIRASGRPDAGSIPILAMSADARDEDMIRSREKGMNGFVTKPVDPDRMFAEIRNALRKGEKADER